MKEDHKNTDRLKEEVSKIDKKNLAKKLEERGVPFYTLTQAVRRGQLSLKLALVMFDITGRSVNFWQAPGIYKTNGDFI